MDACFSPRLPKDWHQVSQPDGVWIKQGRDPSFPAETLEPGDGYRDPTEASAPKRLQQLLKETKLSVKPTDIPKRYQA